MLTCWKLRKERTSCRMFWARRTWASWKQWSRRRLEQRSVAMRTFVWNYLNFGNVNLYIYNIVFVSVLLMLALGREKLSLKICIVFFLSVEIVFVFQLVWEHDMHESWDNNQPARNFCHFPKDRFMESSQEIARGDFKLASWAFLKAKVERWARSVLQLLFSPNLGSVSKGFSQEGKKVDMNDEQGACWKYLKLCQAVSDGTHPLI